MLTLHDMFPNRPNICLECFQYVYTVFVFLFAFEIVFWDRGTLPGYPCVARYGRSILFDWLFYLK